MQWLFGDGVVFYFNWQSIFLESSSAFFFVHVSDRVILKNQSA